MNERIYDWDRGTLGGSAYQRVSFGARDRSQLAFPERMVTKAVHAPEGDFRDWAEIDAWATQIAHPLPLARTTPIP